MYRIDNSTTAAGLAAPTAPGPNPDHYFTDGDPGVPTPATIVDAEWANMVQEELVAPILAAGLALDKADRTQLREAIKIFAGVADMPFMAGYGAGGTGEDVAAQLYGALTLARAVKLTGENGHAVTAPVGQDIVFDIKKNGVSVYTTLPKIVAGATTLTAGALNPAMVDCAAGDLIEWELTQVGTTTAGQKITFTLKAHVI